MAPFCRRRTATPARRTARAAVGHAAVEAGAAAGAGVGVAAAGILFIWD